LRAKIWKTAGEGAVTEATGRIRGDATEWSCKEAFDIRYRRAI